MLVKNITYTDYDGNVRSENFMFNFTKAEIVEMEASTAGGLRKMIEQITEAQDFPKLVSLFKKLVLDAYGVKSPDGRRFIKSQELRDEFSQTEAYSELFMQLARDDHAASDFINGVVPHMDGTPAITK